MYDLHVELGNHPGTLGQFGKAMGHLGVSLEGGGVFTIGNCGQAHFLIEDGERGRRAAEAANLTVLGVSEVLTRRLKQERPGELGAICVALGNAGVNIVTMYSDHANRMILVVDDVAKAESVTTEWRP
jgi:hypothetical protein